MRIIAGSKRGMKLLSPKTNDTRPITDRVKEAVFSILNNRYGMPDGCRVADVCSGTGSLGLESLSRGAVHATFVEMSSGVVEILRKNIEKGRFEEGSKVVRGNAFKVGAPLEVGQEKYDVIFFDPPYTNTYDTTLNGRMGKLLSDLISLQIKPGGLVLVRSHERAVLLKEYGELEVIDRREWGNMAYTFLRLKSDVEVGEVSDDSELADEQ